jgi:hypothetical protein
LVVQLQGVKSSFPSQLAVTQTPVRGLQLSPDAGAPQSVSEPQLDVCTVAVPDALPAVLVAVSV